MGLLLDALIAAFGWQVLAVPGMGHDMLPDVLVYGSAWLLLLLAVPVIRIRVLPVLAR